MKNNKVRDWFRGIFYELQLKVIKLVVGKWSIIVNVNVYGKAMVGRHGLVYKSVFQFAELAPTINRSVFQFVEDASTINSYCGGFIFAPPGTQMVAVSHCVFDASGKERE